MKSPYGLVFAALYDAVFLRAERSGLRAMRQDLLSQCTGSVLEIGAGTGLNIRHYDAGLARLVLTEPEAHMAAKLRAAVTRAGSAADVIEAPAESLPFPDATFDTVVSTLVLCTVPSPDAVVREVKRVLKPGGRFLFIEHVRSDSRRLAGWQDRLSKPWSLFACGCQCNRNTLETIQRGFAIEQVSRDRLIGLTSLVRPLVRGQARAA
ncbi:MAG: class I SAM-dependent methyltransferase [Candidatus Dormibacteraeota bacterium]|nr:class I SAM-dependent methyltransferase [Candidatus Dormibacteraeota bacterium]